MPIPKGGCAEKNLPNTSLVPVSLQPCRRLCVVDQRIDEIRMEDGLRRGMVAEASLRSDLMPLGIYRVCADTVLASVVFIPTSLCLRQLLKQTLNILAKNEPSIEGSGLHGTHWSQRKKQLLHVVGSEMPRSRVPYTRRLYRTTHDRPEQRCQGKAFNR